MLRLVGAYLIQPEARYYGKKNQLYRRLLIRNPRAKITEPAFSEPYLLTETKNQIIDDILALLNKNGLTSHQSLCLLERLGGIIEMGQQLSKETTD